MHSRKLAYFVSAGLLAGLLSTAGHFPGWRQAQGRSMRPGQIIRGGRERDLPRRTAAAETDPARRRQIAADLGKLPLNFAVNRGQLDRRVSYYVQGGKLSVYLTPGGVSYVISAGAPRPSADPSGRLSVMSAAFGGPRQVSPPQEARQWALELEFVDANGEARVEAMEPAPAVVSYFKGSPGEWKVGLPTYARVAYRELWPGIDLVYSGADGRLKSTFVVRPGADPNQIRLAWRGAQELQVNAQGQLEVSTPVGGLREDTPYAYQQVGDQQVRIPAAYRLEGGNSYAFELGAYDPAKPVVVDPVVLAYAGFLGGSADDTAWDIAVDASGNAYVTGYTASDDFPASVGPITTIKGDADAFVAKVKADGSGLVYAGFLGGSQADSGNAIAVDALGNAYVAGETNSADFPAAGGLDATFNGGTDVFVTKINAAGTGLVYSGYIGGSNVDNGLGIAVDKLGNAYLAGSTQSGDFPAGGGPDATYHGNRDAFVAKVASDASGLLWAGYLGGSGNDSGEGIAVDASGNAYVTGSTTSTNFPAANGPDVTFNGLTDAFVAKVASDGSGLVWAGYIGGSSIDAGRDIAVDAAGNAYVTGVTLGGSFPASGGPDTTHNGSYDAFVAKVKADGSGLVYAGFLGGSSNDSGEAIAVDSGGNAYLTGYTESSDFPAAGGPDSSFRGLRDAFVAKISSAATGLVFAGFLGGSGLDAGVGIAVDAAGNAYVTGYTDSGGFPVAAGPDGSYGGEGDAFVVKIGARRVGVDLKPAANPNCVNPKSKGNVGVAIFSTAAFHVAGIDQPALRFGGAAPLRCGFQDVAMEGQAAPDGIPDLVCHFDTQKVSWPAAGANCAAVSLVGNLIDGTPIEGSDTACLAGETTCASLP
jgi:hypothetical protein